MPKKKGKIMNKNKTVAKKEEIKAPPRVVPEWLDTREVEAVSMIKDSETGGWCVAKYKILGEKIIDVNIGLPNPRDMTREAFKIAVAKSSFWGI